MTFCPNWILSADLRSSISRSLNDFTGKVTEEARTADEINKLLVGDARARAPGSGTTTGRALESDMTGQNCGEQEPSQGSRVESGTGRGSEIQSGQWRPWRQGLVVAPGSNSLDLGRDVGCL